MATSTFYNILFLILYSQSTNCDILSQLLPKTAIAPSDATFVLADIPQEMLENLFAEVPELRNILTPYAFSQNRMSHGGMHSDQPLEDVNNDLSDTEVDSRTREKQFASTGLEELTNVSRIGRHVPQANQSRYERNISEHSLRSEEPKDSCYVCGMTQDDIPTNPICHEAFHSSDARYLTLASYLHAKCITSSWYTGKEYHRTHRLFHVEKPTYYAGDFRHGCFKRFLDVGKVYTQRGCRKQKPWTGGSKSFATFRYTQLERRLVGVANGCIMSGHASLTPFDRSVSLFARYHVCVCKGDYCNSANRNALSFKCIYVLGITSLFHLCFKYNVI